MLSELYSKWMFSWETALTTRDTNRIVRPLEWGFDWLGEFGEPGAAVVAAGAGKQAAGVVSSGAAASSGGARGSAGMATAADAPVFDDGRSGGNDSGSDGEGLERMVAANRAIVERADEFFGYETPTDFRLERRCPQLFPTNVRPETLAQDAELKRRAAAGELEEAEFLRFTSAVRTCHPENDVVNARWYPAPEPSASKNERQKGKPKQAIIVMPQWNADAFSHNALCTLFNRFGISALRLSKPFHDIRRPSELERSDYAVSANIGRTTEACRQAVVDVRSCIDWLETEGYEQFGVLGTSLGSCYAFIAAAHDARLRVCAFNHASTWFGDVVWTGQSTRHIRAAFEQAGLTRDQVRKIFTGISPMSYMERFAAHQRRVLVVHATYDLTFLREFSLDVLANFDRCGIDYVSKVLPCGHYTTGETPYKYIDGWYLGSFVYGAFKRLAEEAA
ncbi:MAG TPA: alpha/beta hydrolase family protein [Edaphobacter sp.]|nr:alpha/beta hydrolase family protein [Edaphobacter sp.]